MAQITIAPEMCDDFDRTLDFLFERAPDIAARRDDIAHALDVLQSSPKIECPVAGSVAMRKLVISAVRA
jgi:hypothetical protein